MKSEFTPEEATILAQQAKITATLSPMQLQLNNLIRYGLYPYDILELRLSTREHSDPVDIATRCATAFFSAFGLYPTLIAVHPVVAALFEASEVTISARHSGGKEVMLAVSGNVDRRPIHILADASLGITTAAVRFALEKNEQTQQELTQAVVRFITE